MKEYLSTEHVDTALKLERYGTLPGTVHVFDRDSVDAVNAALAARRPLLVRGEPGTGKSQLARAAAAAMGRAFVSIVIDVRTEARDLLWSFDAVSRLAEAQVQGALPGRDEEKVRESLAEEHFLTAGPLWWAFDWKSAAERARETGAPIPHKPEGWQSGDGVVLLIDEIDKADTSVPNGLLEALGLGRFTCPGGRVVTQKTQTVPLVVVTTNEERALPDPFLRRCLVLQLAWPAEREELIKRLKLRGRAHFERCSEEVLDKAASLLVKHREEVAERGLCPPGGAEYLDLLRALDDLAEDGAEEQLALLERLGQFALSKHPAERRW